MFANSFTSYDFDVDSSNRNDLFNEISMCPKLDALHSALTDSEFVGILTEKLFVDKPLDIQRNKDIVKNLENLSMHVGNNYTIGWAGQEHCVDFHHHLTESNSQLLEKIQFININSPCSDENLVTPEDLSAMFRIYFFSDYIDDQRVSEIYQRALQFINYSFFNEIDTPQEKIHDLLY